MSSIVSLSVPFPIFTDIDGNQVDDGYIYVGTAGLNPETNPITVYSDVGLAVPIAQPVRTSGGYPVVSGSPVRIFAAVDDYSILLKDKHGRLVYSSLTCTQRIPFSFTSGGDNDIVVNGVTIGRGTGNRVENTALGKNALVSNDISGYNNTAVGRDSLYSNTTATNNTAVGYESAKANTIGENLCAIGYRALYQNISGFNNQAFGYQSMFSNTTGEDNLAVGYKALWGNLTGQYNAALGFQAGYSNTSGNANVSVGYAALFSNTTGGNNVAIGNDALYSSLTGSENTAIGLGAIYSNTTGYENAACGRTALYDNTTGYRNAVLGALSAYNNISGYNNTAAGYQSLYTNETGYQNASVGAQSMYYNLSGINNAALGFQSLYNNTSGYQNTAVGYRALFGNTTGIDNVALGIAALKNNTTGKGNIGIGFHSSADAYVPVFDPTTENNRLVMGHTAITNAYVQVAWTVVSDARDKTEIGEVPHGLNFVSQLKPVSYKYKLNRDSDEANGNTRYGFLAQDILALEGDSPVIVDAEDENKLKLVDQNLLAVLVKAVQELKAEVDMLKASK
jgi:hypothetical protein